MRPEFLRDGEFYRSAVVTEIRARKLSRTEIEQIAAEPEIQAEFFGELAPYMRPQKEWDESYMDVLSCVATAECFNKEYLLYLDEVVDYVSKAPRRKMMKWGIAGVLLILAGAVAWILAGK